jgi:DNA-binding MarR family transcriptional regulator
VKKDDADSAPDRHATLGALLRHPYERMYRWLYAELASHGFPEVRPGFSVVLRNLTPRGERVSDLAVRAAMTKQSMAYLVEQMAGVGLVHVTPDETDRRAKLVRLTPRGEEVVSVGVRLATEYERRLGEAVGEKKMAQLRKLLTELYEHLEDAPEPGSNQSPRGAGTLRAK